MAELLERERALGQLEAVLSAAGAGAGALVVIEGAAKIGKTRLLAAARQVARKHGMRELGARGAELERDFAYGVVRQLLEPAVAVERDELDHCLAIFQVISGQVLSRPILDHQRLNLGARLLDRYRCVFCES